MQLKGFILTGYAYANYFQKLGVLHLGRCAVDVIPAGGITHPMLTNGIICPLSIDVANQPRL